jgi:hypothetical protein
VQKVGRSFRYSGSLTFDGIPERGTGAEGFCFTMKDMEDSESLVQIMRWRRREIMRFW